MARRLVVSFCQRHDVGKLGEKKLNVITYKMQKLISSSKLCDDPKLRHLSWYGGWVDNEWTVERSTVSSEGRVCTTDLPFWRAASPS